MHTEKKTAFPHIEVFRREGSPGIWAVEAVDDDGGIEQALFAGRDPEKAAREFAEWRYGVR